MQVPLVAAGVVAGLAFSSDEEAAEADVVVWLVLLLLVGNDAVAVAELASSWEGAAQAALRPYGLSFPLSSPLWFIVVA